MVATNIVPQEKSFLTISTYGDNLDVVSLARRIKIMVPGGKNLNDNEAQALAQVSIATNCNPFIGEIWYIPGSGPMIGIKGTRRHASQQIEDAGGKDAFWQSDFEPCSGEDAGYKGDIRDLAAAYKCTITDSVSTLAYQRMFLETVNTLRAAGSTDPVGEAREICGKRPQWIDYGYSLVSEKSRMNKQALARKRSESHALQLKFSIPFGAKVAAGDDAIDAGDWVEGQAKETTSPSWDNAPEKWDESLETDAKVEEVVIQTTTPAPKAKAPKAEAEKPKGVIGWLIETHQMNTSHAAQVTNLLKLTDPKLTQTDWEKRYNNYRSLRDANLSPEEAAKKALAA